MYKPTPDGLGGNDDTGQMSAWYIFSTLGFYPVAPASADYCSRQPGCQQRGDTGRRRQNLYHHVVKNQSEKNVYVQKMTAERPATIARPHYYSPADYGRRRTGVFYEQQSTSKS
jgi:putative alpha-1,2-mannosidase